jgi:hypothetical protein
LLRQAKRLSNDFAAKADAAAFRVEGSAEKPDAERFSAAPNDLAAARGSPGYESYIRELSNFHRSVDGYPSTDALN